MKPPEPSAVRERPRARWVLPPAPRAEAEGLAAALDLHPLAALLLARRGVVDPEAARRFLKPDISHLHGPERLLRKSRRRARVLQQTVRLVHRVRTFSFFD